MQTVVESPLCSADLIALLAFLKSIYCLLLLDCFCTDKIWNGFYIKMLHYIIS